MSANPERSKWSVAAIGAVLVAGAGAALLAPHDAAAHFALDEPESWREQNVLGDPQKVGPCGNEGTAAETGVITAYRTGQTITITIRETVFHPGHFRVALSTDDTMPLPPVPTVTPGSTACGSVPIMDPPVFPVLADGLLPHTSPLSGTQTMEVTLPPGVTCDRCTLQIVQFMAEHAAPCFYYHCADISISDVVVDSGPPEIDAGTSGGMDAGTTPPSSGGCSAATPGRGGASIALAIAALAIVRLRRRRA
jgi:uncharacterized protein (TIGR03382 family)